MRNFVGNSEQLLISGVKTYKRSNAALRCHLKNVSTSNSKVSNSRYINKSLNARLVKALSTSGNFCVFLKIFQKDNRFKTEFDSILKSMNATINILHFNKNSFSQFNLLNCDLPGEVGDLLLNEPICAILTENEVTYREIVRKIISLEGSDNEFFFVTLLFTREFDSFIRFDGASHASARFIYNSEKSRNLILLEVCNLLLKPAISVRTTFCKIVL